MEVRIMRFRLSSWFALPCLALSCLALLCSAPAFAQEDGQPEAEGTPHLVNPRLLEAMRSRAAKTGVSYAAGETTWVGRRPGAANYWEVGVGPNRPGVNSNGAWTFDTPVHGDSVQGWWSLRTPHFNASGAVRVDVNRPWWAIEMGNSANYVINEARSHDYSTNEVGNRTFGVVGVWHSDPGNTGGGAGLGVGWTPLVGTRSAWMGLRNHGDVTVSDALTGNPFNVDVLQFSTTTSPTTIVGNGTAKRFPGYGSQMDQLLYRDIDVSGLGANNLTLSFNFATQMSTGKNAAPATRVGWFEGDQLSTVAGNFISAEAGAPANSQAPVDSFQVYVGEPVEGTWKGSDGTTRPIYDNLRRWFNEILNKDKRLWVFSATDANAAQTKSIVISNTQVNALKSSGDRLRIVFRVHTNRGFDDEGTAYNSAGKGAAQLDNVAVNLGAGAVTIGDFEGTTTANDIDNSSSFTAEQAWKSTGKPPAIFFHAHDLATLQWEDVCGPPHGPLSLCNMGGIVASTGDHDHFERIGAPINSSNHSVDEAGQWAIVSPTINLKTAGPSTPNGWDITGDIANATLDSYFTCDIYTGIGDIFSTGVSFVPGFQSYPAAQIAGGPAPGTPEWAEVTIPNVTYWSHSKECFPFILGSKYLGGSIRTSNPSGIPDSLRIMMRVSMTCYRFGVTAGCAPTGGLYFDNLSLALVDNVQQVASVEPLNWFQDTFPFNETAGLPGTSNFDTTAALIRTGLNITQTPGASGMRFDVPGDSVVVTTGSDSVRLDMVFRIRPGVGNYVTVGNATSGLRRIPTSTTAVTAGDGSFWGTYKANPGEKASAGAAAQHAAGPSGWSSLVWNSARCDTQETNYFPVMGKGLKAVDVGGAAWQSTLHESDPNYTVLGVSKNRCFVVDTLGSLVDPNVSCNGTPPGWVTALPPSRTGYDGNATTTEYTSILPDGIFTPGTHVQYFFRREDFAGIYPGQTTLVPDTSTVYPQPLEGSLDGHRWQEFSVLPDRWKSGCMLVIDFADGRGDEMAWVSIADSIGFTMSADRGAHNGWSAHNGASPNDPASFVYKNASAGTRWDLFGVKGGDTQYGMSASPGARFAVRDPSVANKVHGKYSMQAPTSEMLQAYYKVVLLLTGDLNDGILGPTTDRTADDVRILEEFMLSASQTQDRVVIASGEGFAESNFDWDFYQETLNTNYFGMDLKDRWYRVTSGNQVPVADLFPASALVGASHASDIYGIRNTCRENPDVLLLNDAFPEVTTGATYANVGANGPYIAVTIKQESTARPWVAIAEGFGIQNLVSRFGDATGGRNAFYYNSLGNTILPLLCGGIFEPGPLDVPGGSRPLVDFASLWNNPLRSGFASFHFGLAKTDRAEIRVYDVGGRLMRTLANRVFPAGEHTLFWDGVDDNGRAVARGVYFARVRYAGGFESAKRIVVLK
jgi:hypothetical protein